MHVDRDNLSAKVWLEPVELARNLGFPSPELRRILRLIEANRGQLLEAWHEHHPS